MFLIGVTEDLIDRDGRPRNPAVDLATRLAGQAVEIWPIAIPPDRIAAPGTTGQFDILVLGDCSISREEILSGQRLRVISRFGKGYDDIDVPAATSRGIIVTRVVKAGEDSMATGVMALILALSTQLISRQAIVSDPDANWDAPLAHGAVGLKAKVLGIVGYGRIGREVARRARCFGFTILCYDPYGPADPDAERVELDDLLARSDFVSVNCPLTAETRGLISWEELRLMKATAYLVNTGRGAVVDESALCTALEQHRLAGAALDVFASEPLPRTSPLRHAPNLIMTPHAIGVSDEMYAEYMESVAVAIMQFMAGCCPSDAINPEAFRTA
jgi:phosphoglycerate dehydrogenase-like enzyme